MQSPCCEKRWTVSRVVVYIFRLTLQIIDGYSGQSSKLLDRTNTGDVNDLHSGSVESTGYQLRIEARHQTLPVDQEFSFTAQYRSIGNDY